jgi:hypothetical protein
MPAPMYLAGAVEGPSDEPVLRRIVEERGAVAYRVQVQNGKQALRRALPGYNAAARWSAWLVLVDLDQDFACPGALVAEWLPAPSEFMHFNVVVRQIEAWLLADGERFARFFSIKRNAIPAAPDELPDAKATVLQLAAASRRPAVRQDMTPRPGSGRRVGPAYTSRLIEFAYSRAEGWRPEVAALRSPSLARCLRRLDELVQDPRLLKGPSAGS